LRARDERAQPLPHIAEEGGIDNPSLLVQGSEYDCEKEEEEGSMLNTISRSELKLKIDRGDKFHLVEVLPQVAYDHAHLPGAVNLPSARLKESALMVLPDKDADIVVYCANPT